MPRMGRDIDDRLADLDRRLREIQQELVPGREPRAPAPPPPPPPPSREPEPEPEPEPPALEPDTERPTAPHPPPPPPRPAQVPAPPPPQPPQPPLALPSAGPITELHAKLLASFRELLDAYEWLLTQTAQPLGPPPGPPQQPRPAAAESHPAGVTAGPFASTDAVRAFEARLAALPGVRAVSIRGYEGADRAIFDIDLGDA